MVNPQICIAWTQKKEGKLLENVPGDTGGLTWWGISRNNKPNFEGWALIDAHINATDDFHKAGFICNADETLIGLTNKFYLDEFNKTNLGQLTYQELALQVFDHYWNMGGLALKVFQILVHQFPDGQPGPLTIQAANAYTDQSGLVDRFLQWCQCYYITIEAKHPEDLKFSKGWESRCVRSDI
jgi:lysozyme family protein